MYQRIKKRDGRVVEFNKEKISQAIFKAAKAAGGEDYQLAQQLSDIVIQYLQNTYKTGVPDVEAVQDAVEKILIETGHAKTAKKYILYRAERNRIREKNTRLMDVFHGITFQDSKDNDTKRENANIDGDTAMGTMLKYGSEAAKEFYEMHVLNPRHTAAHKEGDIHIHDLDFLMLTMTCCQIDILKLFKGGFSTGHGHLREPQDIQSYAALAAIAIQANQNDQHGGQSIPNFDYGLAPGVSKTYIKLYKANLAKAFEILAGLTEEIYGKRISDIVNTTMEETGLKPALDPNIDYLDKEVENLVSIVEDRDVIKKAQSFAAKHAFKESEKRTYQAMEAFVHNLNTMHSRAGQVGRLSIIPIKC